MWKFIVAAPANVLQLASNTRLQTYCSRAEVYGFEEAHEQICLLEGMGRCLDAQLWLKLVLEIRSVESFTEIVSYDTCVGHAFSD
jgi:hypothetical protein